MVEDTKLRGYPKIYNLGHRYLAELFVGKVVVQEKIDGSQISWGVDRQTGQLMIRSKRAIIYPDTADSLFRPSVESILRMFEEGRLNMGWIYRGEAMRGPKHNALEYERAPNGNIVLFDVDKGEEDRIDNQVELEHIAKTLGIECTPVLAVGSDISREELEDLVKNSKPLLGGPMVEGVVIKNYDRFSPLDGKMLMGKIVAQDFREIHAKVWESQSKKDVIGEIAEAFGTQQRWMKAVQHLRDCGELDGSPKDIGPLMKEAQFDIEMECMDEMKDILWKHFRKDIIKRCVSGLPHWYKDRLIENQFDPAEGVSWTTAAS